MTLLETLQEKRSQILEIAARHGAYNVRVFGSVVRGEEAPDSDIDFLIDYDLTKITPWFPVRLIRDLESALEKRVDVVTLEGLKAPIRDQVLQESVKL
jgi:uncharacterized protein